MNLVDVLPKDAIASIDEPAFGTDYFGASDDDVLVVDGNPPRAYPIRILSHHEIVNDTIDGRPIAVTWCPICWSGAVYDRTVDGQTLTFGVSGKLADDALVMYDRETGSEWKQTRGTCITGPLEGRTLTTVPAPIRSWEQFSTEQPDGQVLQPATGAHRSDGTSLTEVYEMEPYERYVDGETFGLYGMRGSGEQRSWNRTDIDAKTIVLGIEHGDEAVGVPVPVVESAGGVVTDSIDGLDVVVFATDDGIHAFEHPGYDFDPSDEGIRADGTIWDGNTGQSEDGRQLERVPARRMFAFAWQDDHGSNAFYS